jgi:hypothetical protein
MDKNTDDALPRTRRGLRDLRLRNRLVLLVLLPLIAAVALGAARVVTENDAITAEGNLAGQVQVALTVSKLVHGVQDERDLIAASALWPPPRRPWRSRRTPGSVT